MSRTLHRAAIGAASVFTVLGACSLAGCDQLNKPFGNTSSSSSSSSGGARASADGGEPNVDADGGSFAPTPAITAQPGDIQL